MAGRRTNLALLALWGLALATGAGAFATGARWSGWAAGAHGAVGVAVVLLVRPKGRIAQSGLVHRRPDREAALALSVLGVLVLAAGLAHASGLLLRLGPFSAMQVHVGAALLALPLFGWHVVARPVRLRRSDLARRSLLGAGAFLGVALITYGGSEGAWRLARLRGGLRRSTGSHETGSLDPAVMPVTQWLDDPVADVDPATWRLAVGAAGDRREWSLAELAAFSDRRTEVLDCTGGWYAEQRWEGVLLGRLLPEPGAARSIVVRSATGYVRRFPVSDLSRLLLALRVGGAPLSPGHGSPARLVAPGRRGFWWVKWVVSVELDERPWWLQSPFPLD